MARVTSVVSTNSTPSARGNPVGGPDPDHFDHLGFDFDPRADLIRILGNQRENIVREANFGLFVRAANTLTYQTGDFSEGFAPVHHRARRSSTTSRIRRSASSTPSTTRKRACPRRQRHSR